MDDGLVILGMVLGILAPWILCGVIVSYYIRKANRAISMLSTLYMRVNTRISYAYQNQEINQELYGALYHKFSEFYGGMLKALGMLKFE